MSCLHSLPNLYPVLFDLAPSPLPNLTHAVMSCLHSLPNLYPVLFDLAPSPLPNLTHAVMSCLHSLPNLYLVLFDLAPFPSPESNPRCYVLSPLLSPIFILSYSTSPPSPLPSPESNPRCYFLSPLLSPIFILSYSTSPPSPLPNLTHAVMSCLHSLPNLYLVLFDLAPFPSPESNPRCYVLSPLPRCYVSPIFILSYSTSPPSPLPNLTHAVMSCLHSLPNLYLVLFDLAPFPSPESNPRCYVLSPLPPQSLSCPIRPRPLPLSRI